MVVLEDLLRRENVLGEVVLKQNAHSLLVLLQRFSVVLHRLLEYFIEAFVVSLVDILCFGRKLLFAQLFGNRCPAGPHQSILMDNYKSKSLKSLARSALSYAY